MCLGSFCLFMIFMIVVVGGFQWNGPSRPLLASCNMNWSLHYIDFSLLRAGGRPCRLGQELFSGVAADLLRRLALSCGKIGVAGVRLRM